MRCHFPFSINLLDLTELFRMHLISLFASFTCVVCHWTPLKCLLVLIFFELSALTSFSCEQCVCRYCCNWSYFPICSGCWFIFNYSFSDGSGREIGSYKRRAVKYCPSLWGNWNNRFLLIGTNKSHSNGIVLFL